MNTIPSSFWFRGGSWGIIYYSGVYKAIKKKYTKKQLANVKWGGVSAGAIVSLFGALELEPRKCSALFDKLAVLASTHGSFGNLSIYHDMFLNDLLPDNGNEWKKLNNKIFIGITRFPFTQEIISTWRSNKELRDTLHASMHLPFYMSCKNKVNGIIAIDGDIIPNNVKLDDNTIHVGMGNCKNYDISPSIPISWRDCFAPPSKKEYSIIEKCGEEDADKWFSTTFHNKRVIMPPKRSALTLFFQKPNYIICLFLWVLRYIEEYKKNCLGIFLTIWTYQKIKHAFLKTYRIYPSNIFN